MEAKMLVEAPKTPGYLEVERKFDVGESTVSPSFAGVAAVAREEMSPTQALDAVYFDTPGGDLASKRITLRRRTGGSDAGWHLKLPAGPDARTEVRAPLGAVDCDSQDGVPGELLDVVLAIVRDRPLAPVARICTRRETHLLYGADGAALAEFCDDHVTASSAASSGEVPAEQHWREWEVELVGPAVNGELLDRLSSRMLDAGAVPAGRASKLARVLGETPTPNGSRADADPVHRAVADQVEQLLVWDRAVRADVADAVHQMRVTTRRLRSLLQASPEQFGLSDDAGILDELRELASVLGTARDAEVLGEQYRRALDRLPPELVRGPVRKRLVDGAKRRYRDGLGRSLTAMRSPRYFRLLDALDALVAEQPATGRGQKSATIDAAYKRVLKAEKKAARAPDTERNEALHRIRKRAKRLRYIAAATGATKVSKRAKAVQSLLGAHQDSVVSRAHLSQQADAAHAASADTFTYGLLYQQDADLADSCRQQLDAALRKLKKSMRKTQH
jgi:CHAD domain-containing protein